MKVGVSNTTDRTLEQLKDWKRTLEYYADISSRVNDAYMRPHPTECILILDNGYTAREALRKYGQQ